MKQRMEWKKGLLSLFLLFGPFFSVMASPTKVTLQLKWRHQFQFAGYYVAKELGYYRDLGLEVDIVEAVGNDTDSVAKVLDNHAQFGISHSGLLKHRLQGQPVVAMAALMQSSPYCWLVKKHSPIFAPQDFDSKKISSLSASENAELITMLANEGIQPEVVDIGAQEPLAAWIEGRLDAIQVYITNEPYTLAQQGIDYRLVCPKQHGFNVYGDVLFTSQTFLDAQPEVVARFYQASMRGWRYALLNLQHSIALTKRHYAVDKSLQELAFEADQLKPLMMRTGSTLGAMSDARWRLIAELYALDDKPMQEYFRGFMYQPIQQSGMRLSWMFILAIAIILVAVPTYVRLVVQARKSK
ncbi:MULTISPECIES: ABC transporter substrate-binding protein [Pseudoalteromonas]|uniref:Thiamine pyrimidine synthase n=1 Tax=Pseudoalteromonas ruthenica TaxID=151081 RepID=A0A5S3Z1I2_9GAMM|nr:MULTISPECIES: ABC transporter substrate-binding protein [Pseudoalteromonas]MCG7559711.1 ABC transporter substrate-binding protein [Pseudoalteromonas sp. CNAT2-18.1]MCG7566668.1 ABC transporter substrate-binding protein [Pseudoalteromonas sp. CnMc7-15]MCF2861916.1 ABC transporter substrate-binding protein [Pseudoalteromonas sp. CNAT2-18]TMO85973.1 diguanylate cyclase [Pseudoalteromonas ruthenica]TMO93637.1 diguanylate cyclase [Pseudoalteromonas ruthenica]